MGGLLGRPQTGVSDLSVGTRVQKHSLAGYMAAVTCIPMFVYRMLEGGRTDVLN